MSSRAARRKAPASPEFTVRRASEADLDVLVEQRVSMYREMMTDIKPDFRAYGRRYRSWARKMMKRKKLVSFLVIAGRDKPVAGGSLWIRENQPSPRFPGTEIPYLMSMFTDPAHRRKGLATLVVKEATRWSRKHGYPRVTLHASNMGEPVYAKLGFQRTTEMRLPLDSPLSVQSGLPHRKP